MSKFFLQIVHASASLFQMLYDLTPANFTASCAIYSSERSLTLLCLNFLSVCSYDLILTNSPYSASKSGFLSGGSGFFRHKQFVLVTHKTFLKLN